MGLLAAFTTKSSGQTITASLWNGNFDAIHTWATTYAVHTDVAATISANHTFSGTPVFSNGATFSAGATVSGGDLTVSGTSNKIAVSGSSGAIVARTDPGGTATLRVSNGGIPAYFNTTGSDGRVEFGVSASRTGVVTWDGSNIEMRADSGKGSKILVDGDSSSKGLVIASSGAATFSHGITVTTSVAAVTLSVSGNASVVGTATVGTLAATTISGNPAFSGNPTFASAPSFAGATLTSTLSTSATGATNAIDFTGSAPRIRLASGGSLSVRNNSGTEMALFNSSGLTIAGSSGFNLTPGDPAAATSSNGFLVAGTLITSPSGTPPVGSIVVNKAGGNERLWVYCTAGWKSVALA